MRMLKNVKKQSSKRKTFLLLLFIREDFTVSTQKSVCEFCFDIFLATKTIYIGYHERFSFLFCVFFSVRFYMDGVDVNSQVPSLWITGETDDISPPKFGYDLFQGCALESATFLQGNK